LGDNSQHFYKSAIKNCCTDQSSVNTILKMSDHAALPLANFNILCSFTIKISVTNGTHNSNLIQMEVHLKPVTWQNKTRHITLIHELFRTMIYCQKLATPYLWHLHAFQVTVQSLTLKFWGWSHCACTVHKDITKFSCGPECLQTVTCFVHFFTMSHWN